ncbi:MAG TPA: hypothetical protein DCW88_08055 [Agrobacterium sp.]|nr:hypothetical protein [Agrobacterium sp.]
MTSLVLKDIRKSYGQVKVLHGIDLDIEQGEFIVFVGPSGCGKSTLLRMIAGLEEITGGEMYIDGQLVNEIPPSRRGIAMVFQSYALYPHMTVYDNMAFGMKIARESKQEIDRRVRAAAEILQLTQYLERLPKALSGGQRQSVAIARAILFDARILIMDEPTAALGPQETAQVGDLVKELKRQGIGIFLISHDIHDVFDLADRVFVMKNGKVVGHARTQDVTKDEVLGMIILGKVPAGAVAGPGAVVS